MTNIINAVIYVQSFYLLLKSLFIEKHISLKNIYMIVKEYFSEVIRIKTKNRDPRRSRYRDAKVHCSE